MLFINNTGETVKVRSDDVVRPGMYKWKNLKDGETIDVFESYGINLGLNPAKKVNDTIEDEIMSEPESVEEEAEDVEEENEVNEESDTSQKDYEERLKSVEGLGKKTFKDILEIYPTLNDLSKAISEGKTIPVRDDVEKGILVEFA